MNKSILIGRLTKAPELSYTPQNNTAICRFTLAVDRPKRKDAEEISADFIRITCWGKQAETCDRYLDKGRQVAIIGHIKTGSYKDKDGRMIYTTEVEAEHVEFLGGGNGSRSQDPDPEISGSSETYTRLDDCDVSDAFQAVDSDVPF